MSALPPSSNPSAWNQAGLHCRTCGATEVTSTPGRAEEFDRAHAGCRASSSVPSAEEEQGVSVIERMEP